MTVMVDPVKQQGGFERPPDGLATRTCPECGGVAIASYGLAYGGFGGYVACDGHYAGDGQEQTRKACGWFYKKQDEDGHAPERAPADPRTGRQRTRALWRRRGRR